MSRTAPSIRLSGRSTLAAALVPIAFLGVFFAWPLAAIVWRGVAPDGTPDLPALVDVVTNSRWWRVGWFTTWQATLSTVATLVVGLPIAGVLANHRVPGAGLLRGFFTVPFVMPTVVVATAFLAVFDALGEFGDRWRESVAAIIVAHVFFNIAVVVRTVTDPWSRLDPGVEHAARMLGRSAWSTVWSVTLPRLRAPIAAASAIVFLFSFTSFGVVLLLGGPGRTTLEVETYVQTTAFLRLDVAAVLAMTQLAIVVGLLALQRRIGSVVTSDQVRARDRRGPVVGWRARTLVGGVLGGAVAFVAVPMGILVVRSLRVDGWSLDNYRALGDTPSISLVPPSEAITASLTIAAWSSVVAVVVGGLASAVIVYGRGRGARWLDGALMLPLGTSAVTLGFGMLIALDEPPLDLRASALLVPIAHALIGVPFVIRLMVPAIRSIDDRHRQASLLLGTPPWATWRRVDLPIVWRSLTAATAFAFTVSLGEFGATAFLVRPDRPTVPTMIVRLIGRPGATNFGQAMAMATILMALTIVAVAAIERARVGEHGDF